MATKSPYDEKKAQAENLTELLFTYEKDGNYGKRVGYDYVPDGEMLYYDVWKMFRERIEEARKDVLEGKRSPVWYHMEKNLIDLANFAKLVELPSWRVKRHLNPKVFSKLKPSTIQKYAEALDISMDEFINIK